MAKKKTNTSATMDWAIQVRSHIQSQLPASERTLVQVFLDQEKYVLSYNIPSGLKINKKTLPLCDGWTIKEN